MRRAGVLETALAVLLGTALAAGVAAQAPPAEAAEETPPVAGAPPRVVVRPPSQEALEEDLESGLEDPTAPPAGAEKRAEAAAAEAPDPTADWSSFSITLEDGGRVTGKARTFEYEPGQYLLAPEGIELRHRDIEVTAARARLEIATNVVTAEGDVVIDEGTRRLTGDTLEYDLDTRTGRLTNATAFVDPDYYFDGAEIAKVAEDTYTITDGVFTSCSQDVPDWSIHLSSARVTLEEYARIRNARLKAKRVPIVYIPYLLWPAKTDRASGFLVPQPSYSRRRGGYLGLAYFQTMGRSADSTFFLDLYSKEFFGFGTEVRYHTSEHTEGILRGYVLSEPDDFVPEDFAGSFDPDYQPGDTRWKLQLFHSYQDQIDFWGNVKAVVDLQEYSDFDFLSDYERSVQRQTQSVIYSKAFWTANRGTQSWNVLVDERERIARAGVTTLRQLPEVEYNLRSTQLGGTPLYLSLASSLHYLQVERPNLESEYGRADLFPTLSAPLSDLPWLSARVDVGGRVTHYTDSTPEGNPNQFSGESLTRTYPQGGLEVVGPSFSRIFDASFGRFAKLKHLVEPRVVYLYRGEFDDSDRVPLFDELDFIEPSNGVVYSLVNRFLAKPRDPDDGGAYEIASFELQQSYSFDEDRPGQRSGQLSKREGPLRATLRVNPSLATSVKTELTYNTLFSQLQALSFSGSTKLGRHSLGLTWFTRWNPESGESTSDQARFFTSLWLSPDKLRLDSEISYDLERSEVLQQRHFVTWQAQCWGMQLELREATFSDVTDRDFRFALTLKNVGTFIDLTGGVDSF